MLKVLVVVGLLLAGCGDDSDGATPTPPMEPAAEPAAAAGDEGDVAEAAPLHVDDDDAGELISHQIDLVELNAVIAERSGASMTFSGCATNMVLGAVEHGEVDERVILDWMAGNDPIDALPATESLRLDLCPGHPG